MSSSLPPAIAIRLARSDDMPHLVRLQLDSIQTLCAKDYTPEQLEALIDSKANIRVWQEQIFVAEIAGQIVGFGALALCQPSINALFVDPNFARQGIGQQLLATLEKAALERNIRCLWVSASLTGVPFYQAQKYETVCRDSVWLSLRPVPVMTMKKVLIPPTQSEIIWTWIWYSLLILFVICAIVLPLIS
ncbi:GNAT family N-acetyltransferase [Pantanalinema sp. GBBB05]|uniref:GNAT family N-acetyltransferase n=1 Tax=Pantanalinema sp. GBBB05 TaxID=2604139 RepID=UPI001DEAD956|nr:GNAT family N-acetyltransferase [Pantanalinema sp. GBBB05]